MRSRCSLGDVAVRLELSLAYLEQLFMKLRRNGLVQSVRGPGGGYVLGRDADTISICEIMSAVDEPFKMTRCDERSRVRGNAPLQHALSLGGA